MVKIPREQLMVIQLIKKSISFIKTDN